MRDREGRVSTERGDRGRGQGQGIGEGHTGGGAGGGGVIVTITVSSSSSSIVIIAVPFLFLQLHQHVFLVCMQLRLKVLNRAFVLHHSFLSSECQASLQTFLCHVAVAHRAFAGVAIGCAAFQ